MITFYDQAGVARVWLQDGTLHGYSGHVLGTVSGDAVFNHMGRFPGWVIDGWLCEADGSPVLFSDSATGGPSSRGIPQPGRPAMMQGGGASPMEQPPASKPNVKSWWSNRTALQLLG